jgi:hypothetical protein
VLTKENTACFQVGCDRTATKWFALKRQTSARGELLDPGNVYSVAYRQFCDRHAHRGDCSIEDCDTNYVPIIR